MKFNQRTIGILLILIAVVSYFAIPLELYFSNTPLMKVIFFMSVGLVMLGSFLCLEKLINNNETTLIITLLTFPLFGVTQAFIKTRIEEDLVKKDGIKTIGVVSEKWKGRRKGYWLYKVEYLHNGITYNTTGTLVDDSRTISVGDSLIILYSKSIPSACKIKE